MARPENAYSQISTVLGRSLVNIASIGNETHRNLCSNIESGLRSEELSLAEKFPEDERATLTGVTFFPHPRNMRQAMPIIFVDIGKVLGSRDEVVQADLVRTLAVAEQCIGDGRSAAGSYRDTYLRALREQREWLEQSGMAHLPALDPRVEDNETLLSGVLGDSRYLSDVSLYNWEQAVATILAGKPTTMESSLYKNLLQQLDPTVSDFLLTRERHIQKADRRLSTPGESDPISFYDEVDRADACAFELVDFFIRDHAKEATFDFN